MADKNDPKPSNEKKKKPFNRYMQRDKKDLISR